MPLFDRKECLMNSLNLSEESVETLQVQEKDGIQSVSARELYKGLQIKLRFSQWWENNSKDFVENEDFTTVLVNTEVQNNGGVQVRELEEHYISLDMAKAICLMSRTEIGKKYRLYLISLEKAWNNPEMVMKRALQYANERAEKLLADCALMKPKADVYDSLCERKYLKNFRDTAAYLDMTQNAFMKILRDKYIYKTKGGEYKPYAEFQKYFSERAFAKGVNKTGNQLLVNMEGLKFFTERYKNFPVEKIEECKRKIKNPEYVESAVSSLAGKLADAAMLCKKEGV